MWKRYGGNKGQGKNYILQSKGLANNNKWSTNTPVFPTAMKVLQVVPSARLHSLHKGLILSLPLRTTKIW